MLNWIWLGLIVIAIVVAGGRDISEFSGDRFRNDKPLVIHKTDSVSLTGYVTRASLTDHYGEDPGITADTLPVTMEVDGNGKIVALVLPENAPKIWKEIAEVHGDGKKITGSGFHFDHSDITFTPEPVRFRFFAKITDSLVKSVETAVTLALGLIGIMALWLGIMKIAEAAGFVTVLAKMARPLMKRLFPEVPPEHPAMGAMLSNMAANFLGLSNAATPLGLKAMEELNKLNPVSGTATNAMCMFLTINTSAITLIPATVIAVRASLGSRIRPISLCRTLVATVIALTCGVFFNRFIQRSFRSNLLN